MELNINGVRRQVADRHAQTPLLWVLRDVVGERGTKFGCGAGFCAACTVLIDGRNQKSCQVAAAQAVGKAIVTVEGASGRIVDAVRDAWHRGNVVQCGYCQPGQTLAAVALLQSNSGPDDTAIDNAMSGNICRCGTYPRIRSAIHEAARALATGGSPAALKAISMPEVQRLTPEEAADSVHPYLRVRDDGSIVVFCTQLEMGQGIHTGFATLVAEEMNADFDTIRVVNAANGRGPAGDVYGNPDSGGSHQWTGASNSMKGSFLRYRRAGAEARARLVAAAAWGVSTEEIKIDGGVLSHSSGRRAGFGEFAARAEKLPVPKDVRLKDPSQFKQIGRERRLRVDAPNKILGRTDYTIDINLPGMVVAAVLHAPHFGAKVASLDDRAARGEAGVIAVVKIEAGVAVVGETFADAVRGLRALNVSWDDSGERRSSKQLLADHLRLLESGEGAVVSRNEGAVDQALASAKTTIDATYTVPYLAHAAMEPFNGVCRMRDDGTLEVWASTETPVYVQMSASQAADIAIERVHVNVTFAGGSFGLHSTSKRDPTAEVVQIAKALGWKYPVKVQSLREEDFKIGHYRTMAVHRVRAGVDDAGRVTAMHHEMVAEPTSVRLPFVGDVLFKDGVDFMTVTGVVDGPYAVPNFRLVSTNFESGVPIMVWRSVGNSHTEFARESAIDELARAAERDPVELRRSLLANNPRTLRALDLVVQRSDWGKPMPERKARGIACSNFLSHSAQVIEISLNARGHVHIDRIIVALDCGICVNPDLVRAQVEGGLLFALSAAAWEEIVLGEEGEVQTQNFDRYPVMRMRNTPAIEVYIIESSEPPTGVGEVSVPLAAPALANAIASLTGKRVRQLPFKNSVTIA